MVHRECLVSDSDAGGRSRHSSNISQRSATQPCLSNSKERKRSGTVAVLKRKPSVFRRDEQAKCATVANPYCLSDDMRGYDTRNFTRLQNLTYLKEMKMISAEEYNTRKKQLVDELTGTRVRASLSNAVSTASMIHPRRKTMLPAAGVSGFPNRNAGIAPVVPGPPPDFHTLLSEAAVKHVFDSVKHCWVESHIRVQLRSSRCDQNPGGQTEHRPVRRQKFVFPRRRHAALLAAIRRHVQ
eukprot:974629_1